MDNEDIIKSFKNKKYKKIDNKKSKYISNLFTRTLLSIIVVLITAIYINMNSKNLSIYKENLFEKSLSFNKISNVYNKMFGKVLPLELDKGTTKTVFNNSISYNDIISYEDGYKLTLNNNVVTNLYDGIVVFIGQKDNYENTVIVQGSDGVDIWYGNVTNIGVTLYDYINKDTVIGEAVDNKLYLVFNQEDSYLGYENYLK
jgi:stage IV sporulation protein FA